MAAEKSRLEADAAEREADHKVRIFASALDELASARDLGQQGGGCDSKASLNVSAYAQSLSSAEIMKASRDSM